MPILITGGNAPFSRHLAQALAPDNTVLLFDTHFDAPTVDGVQFLTGDLRQPEQIGAALADVDTVIHLAPLTAHLAEDEAQALDTVTRGSYVLMQQAHQAGVSRLILGSTLDLFDRLPAHWKVNEWWRPRPTPALSQLCPWLAELSVRESARVGNIQVVCLRFGRIVGDEMIQGFDPRWLHQEDAVHGVHQALAYTSSHRPDWALFHITAPGPQAKIRLQYAFSHRENFGYQPTHDFQTHWGHAGPPQRDERPWREVLGPVQRIPTRPIRRVVILGAGGPMGSVTTQELASSYTLRVTDVRPLTEIAAEARPQAPGAPLPVPLASPHENRVVDVRDSAQVLEACRDMDAILNCTVVRPHPVDAFLVNTLGAYHVAKAAVAQGIRRIVHTGPLVQDVPGGSLAYGWDYDLHVDAPARPLDHLYIHSKYLGQEICRVFADAYDLEIPILLFASLINPETITYNHPFQISWADTGRALRRALEVTSLPAPYVMMNISADLPHGRFDHDKAREVLNWAPRDGLEGLWGE